MQILKTSAFCVGILLFAQQTIGDAPRSATFRAASGKLVSVVADVDPETQAIDFEDGGVISHVERSLAIQKVLLAITTNNDAAFHNDSCIEYSPILDLD